MRNLFSVLRKPNVLDELSEGDRKNKPWLWNTVRGQITILHALGRMYVITSCLAIAYSSVAHGIPILYRDSPDHLFYAQILMCYLCFHLVTNFVLVFYFANKSHFSQCGRNELPLSSRIVKPAEVIDYRGSTPSYGDWRKCQHCEVDVPPRARHCSVCQACILKKDHHCFFTGCCIGFYNQRFFITFCILGGLTGTWACYNLSAYLASVYAPVCSLQIYKYFMPYVILSLLLGYNTFFNFCLVLLLYLHVSCTATAIYYFCWNMLVIARGQTSYEFMKGKKLYHDNFWYNIRSVFGKHWFVGLLVPLPILTNEGDGIAWQSNTKTS